MIDRPAQAAALSHARPFARRFCYREGAHKCSPISSCPEPSCRPYSFLTGVTFPPPAGPAPAAVPGVAAWLATGSAVCAALAPVASPILIMLSMITIRRVHSHLVRLESISISGTTQRQPQTLLNRSALPPSPFQKQKPMRCRHLPRIP